ncbi:hypothetical protein [Tsukamurella soli]|uniref:N-terminal of MaoC-like dehydratase domain-containing protein n=1 Tax=Tsukamurella soli TaxID=644556 RepID=A0ABP8JRN9_9ACTN
MALPRWNPSGLLGTDGHPPRGGFLPPTELPRRMFAGGAVEFLRPLTVGTAIRREAEVTAIADKTGRSGRLVVVDVQYRLFDTGGDLAVRETQNLVYREAAPATDTPAPVPETIDAPGLPLRRISDTEWLLRTDPSLLPGFSALTANAHRTHHDWPGTSPWGIRLRYAGPIRLRPRVVMNDGPVRCNSASNSAHHVEYGA